MPPNFGCALMLARWRAVAPAWSAALASVLQSKTAWGGLFGRTILRMFANAILLSSFNNLFANRASRFEPSPSDFSGSFGPQAKAGTRDATTLQPPVSWTRPRSTYRQPPTPPLLPASLPSPANPSLQHQDHAKPPLGASQSFSIVPFGDVPFEAPPLPVLTSRISREGQGRLLGAKARLLTQRPQVLFPGHHRCAVDRGLLSRRISRQPETKMRKPMRKRAQ